MIGSASTLSVMLKSAADIVLAASTRFSLEPLAVELQMEIFEISFYS